MGLPRSDGQCSERTARHAVQTPREVPLIGLDALAMIAGFLASTVVMGLGAMWLLKRGL